LDYDIIIIGGGASGLMASLGAASVSRGARIAVLEKMPRPARKILLTGKGRCNMTNRKQWDDFSQHIKSGAAFISPSFHNLTPEDVIALFEDEGLRTVTERGDRVFPESHRAVDVVDTLVAACRKRGISILTGQEVWSMEVDGTASEPHFAIRTRSSSFSCKRLIVATGGLSYPSTGSTGDGYAFAKETGHQIRPTFPSLTALVPRGYKLDWEKDPLLKGHIDRGAPLSEMGKSLCGNSLKNVGLTLSINGEELQDEFGDIDFTDGGIEGPIGFHVSRACVKAMLSGAKASVCINTKYGVEAGELFQRVEKLWSEVKADPRSRKLTLRRMAEVLLGKLLPRDVIHAFLQCNPAIVKGKGPKAHLDTKALCSALQSWTFEIEGFVGYERAVVTAGGVSISDIVAKTLESRKVRGLHFCGEVLDIDADTGGYNLQCAFSSGYLAGQSAAKALCGNPA